MTQNALWTLFPPTRRVRFNLLVGWHAVRLFVTGYFPPILWFHLLLIQFLGQDEGKGKLSTGTRCLLFLRRQESYCSGSQMRHYMQAHARMYVLQVVTGVSGNKNEQTWNYCICFSKNCAWETRDCCLHNGVALLQGSLQHNEIITLIEMSPFLLIKGAASGQRWKSLVNTQTGGQKQIRAWLQGE